jgi:hypothetical protein
MSIAARIATVLALALVLLGAGWRIHVKADAAGYDRAQLEHRAHAGEMSEKRRNDERRLTIVNQEIDRALQKSKAVDAAANRELADSLRQLEAASDRAASSDPAPTSGIVDPRPTIASECPAALAAMDQHARSLGTLLAALQDRSQRMCVNRPD